MSCRWDECGRLSMIKNDEVGIGGKAYNKARMHEPWEDVDYGTGNRDQMSNKKKSNRVEIEPLRVKALAIVYCGKVGLRPTESSLVQSISGPVCVR